MWFAFIVVLFLSPEGQLEERVFRSEVRYESSTQCLQQAGQSIINAVPQDQNIRAYSVICRQEPQV
jgi:hypothetical protein